MVSNEQQQSIDPVLVDLPGHGNTVAAWAMFGIMFAGFLLGCVGFLMSNVMLIVVGAVIMVVGIIVGVALRAAGYGVGGKHTKGH